jgi:hypothetical protein
MSSYAYPIDQCDVLDRASLVKFRERRSEWLVWLKHDAVLHTERINSPVEAVRAAFVQEHRATQGEKQ